jgi:hypothetical protein
MGMPASSSIRPVPRLTFLAATVALAAAAPAAIVACGSGPSAPVDTIFATPALSGYVVGGAEQAVRSSNDLAVGDANANVYGSELRGVMSFDLTQIPTGSTVTGVTLFTRECTIVGSPIPGLGDVLIEHVSYGATLDTSAFDTPVLDTTGGILSTDSTIGRHTRNVLPAVLADIAAGRSVTQFRLQMSEYSNTGDSANNYVAFQAPSGASSNLCNPVIRQGVQILVSYRQ